MNRPVGLGINRGMREVLLQGVVPEVPDEVTFELRPEAWKAREAMLHLRGGRGVGELGVGKTRQRVKGFGGESMGLGYGYGRLHGGVELSQALKPEDEVPGQRGGVLEGPGLNGEGLLFSVIQVADP